MELKLNIYKGRKIEKTYTVHEYDIMLGTVEDLICLLDSKAFLNFDQKDEDWFSEVIGIVTGVLGNVKELLKDIFVDVTDEELKRIRVKEVIRTVILPMMSLSNFGLEATEKN